MLGIKKKIVLMLGILAAVLGIAVTGYAAEPISFRVIDEAGVFTETERAELEEELKSYSDAYATDAAIAFVNGIGDYPGMDAYSEALYNAACLGRGEMKDGCLLVLDMQERNMYLYVNGENACRFITDRAQDVLMSDYFVGNLGDENDYYAACEAYVGGLNELYEEGIGQDQYSYHTETGKSDYYYPRHSLTVFEIIISVLIAFFAGFLPVSSIRKKYAMKTEKKMAANFRLAYRSEAKFDFASTAGGDRLINRFVTTTRIPRNNNTGNGHGGSFGGGSFGGGRTTVTGSGSSMHSGSGRKF